MCPEILHIRFGAENADLNGEWKIALDERGNPETNHFVQYYYHVHKSDNPVRNI